jgi:hypothetical protein
VWLYWHCRATLVEAPLKQVLMGLECVHQYQFMRVASTSVSRLLAMSVCRSFPSGASGPPLQPRAKDRRPLESDDSCPRLVPLQVILSHTYSHNSLIVSPKPVFYVDAYYRCPAFILINLKVLPVNEYGEFGQINLNTERPSSMVKEQSISHCDVQCSVKYLT